MKKIIALSFGLMLAAAAASAQPSITYAKHALQAGDVHQTRTVTQVNPGASGPNVVWDFSASPIVGEVYDETLSAAGGRIVATNKNGVSFQFDVTPYGNDYYGYQVGPHTLVYEQPVLKTKYPFSFMDQHSGSFTGYITQGAQKYAVEGTFSSEVDGYGTLKLPGGVTLNNVLRVKTVDAQQQQYGSVNSYTEVKYLWYSQDFRYPVFVCIQSVNERNGSRSESNTAHVSVAALNPLAPKSTTPEPGVTVGEVEHRIFPNPVETSTSISYTLPKAAKVSVAVYSSSNVCLQKLVHGVQQEAGSYAYSYAPQLPGIYFVRFAFGDKVYVETIVKK